MDHADRSFGRRFGDFRLLPASEEGKAGAKQDEFDQSANAQSPASVLYPWGKGF
jgi:hypothetical protein